MGMKRTEIKGKEGIWSSRPFQKLSSRCWAKYKAALPFLLSEGVWEERTSFIHRGVVIINKMKAMALLRWDSHKYLTEARMHYSGIFRI